MFADISWFSALYEANLFLNPADFRGERVPLSVPREEEPTCSGWSGQSSLQLVVYVRTRDGSQGPWNRISRACLSAFPYLTPIFLRLEGVLPLTKHTGWCKWSPEMQLYCKHPVLLKTAGICSTCCFLFVHHFVLALFRFFFCLSGRFSRFKTAVEEMSPSKHTCT